MCDVTKENFYKLLPSISRAIKNAAFIAIDGEFTGLSTSNTYEPTLFDTPEERYVKLKRSLSKFTICQLGVACFVPNKDNSFDTFVFNIYTCPATFGLIDSKFSCQFIKEGVPYLNKDQQVVLRDQHKKGTATVPSLHLKQIDEKYVKPMVKQIEEFLIDMKRDLLTLQFVPVGIELYILLKSIQKRFSNLECFINDDGHVTIKKILDGRQGIQFDTLYERILQETIGVSLILDLVVESKKPLIGHNMFCDLILIYERFFHRLPTSYEAFKREISDRFPKIYDTKNIANALKREFRDLNFPEFTSLEDLYQYFNSTGGFQHRIYTPRFVLDETCKRYESSSTPHEAGYDAFSTGVVFLKMAHLAATKHIKLSNEKPLEVSEYLQRMNEFIGCVNMARAAVRYVVFNGRDPEITFPERFIVRSRKKVDLLVASQVAIDFLPFGSVDVKMRSNREAIIAVSHRRRARNLVKAFAKNKYYVVESFDWWKHSNEARQIRLVGFASLTVMSLSTTVFLWKRCQ